MYSSEEFVILLSTVLLECSGLNRFERNIRHIPIMPDIITIFLYLSFDDSFDMYFFNNADFETFKRALDAGKYDNYTTVSLYVANDMEIRPVDAYITIAPAMTRYAHGAVKYDVFTVTIEER